MSPIFNKKNGLTLHFLFIFYLQLLYPLVSNQEKKVKIENFKFLKFNNLTNSRNEEENLKNKNFRLLLSSFSL